MFLNYSRSCAAGVIISPKQGYITLKARHNAPRAASHKKGQTMIKIYCDLCRKEMQETGYKGQFFIYDYVSHTYKGETAQLDICPECYGKITSPDLPEKKELSIEAAEKTEKNNSVFKKLGKALEELEPNKKAEKGPEKKKVVSCDVNKETDTAIDKRASGLDDGKIWALYTGKIPWTIEQIADEMNVSTTTIYNHLKRMRKEKGIL